MGLATEIAELKRDRERLGKSRARDSYKPLKPDKLQSGTDGEWELFAEQMEGYMEDLYIGEGLRLLQAAREREEEIGAAAIEEMELNFDHATEMSTRFLHHTPTLGHQQRKIVSEEG